MNYFIQFLIVFDLICFGVYFGGDIVCTALAKVRKKTDEEEFEIYKVEDDTDTSKPALSIDAIRHLFRGEVHDFVCNKLLPSGQETLSALTEPEQTAARFLFCALIGYLKEEAPRHSDGGNRCPDPPARGIFQRLPPLSAHAGG